MARRRLTEEQEIILDAWYQFGVRYVRNGRPRIWDQGLSSLEWQYQYLRQNEIIRKDGIRYGEYKWACDLKERGRWEN